MLAKLNYQRDHFLLTFLMVEVYNTGRLDKSLEPGYHGTYNFGSM
jgi:hypothetical protein